MLERVLGRGSRGSSSGAGDLEDRLAVVTGAASGIGEALAEELTRRGARVVLLDVAVERLERVVERLGASGLRCDAREPAQVTAAGRAGLP